MPTQGQCVGHISVIVIVKGKCVAVDTNQTIVAANVLACPHDGQTRPTIDAFHELAVHLEIEAGGVSLRRLVGIIADADIIDVVRDDMGEILVIQFRSQDERPVPSMELEIVTRHNLIGVLRFGVFEKAAIAVADFAVERRLVVHTAR